MLTERIKLIPENDDAYLDTYICNTVGNFKRKAILVIPGGGYQFVCAEREGYPVAEAFIPYGFDAFVLNYSVNRERSFPAQLIEVSAAMKYIRDNAERFGIDPAEVYAIGFSAGGHLCGSLGTLWHLPAIYEAIPMEYGYNKPKGIMMIYPVVSGDKSISHAGSFINLLDKDDPTDGELASVSLENLVSDKNCPVFLVHTANDMTVNVKNSLRMAEACSNANIPFEMHIFPDAPHGMSLANDITSIGIDAMRRPDYEWVKLAVEWTKHIR